MYSHIWIKAVAMPVIYTKDGGGGANEYQAPEGTSKTYFIPVADQGVVVQEAWYCPMDNIADLPAISNIVCDAAHNGVSLTVGAPSGVRRARVRIKIYAAMYQG